MQVIASLGLAADAPPVVEHPQASHLVACTTEDAAGGAGADQAMMPAFDVFSNSRGRALRSGSRR